MPILDVLWSMLIFFLFIAWIWVLISVIGDIFRSDDMGGVAKAIWVLFVMLLPWLGVLIYLIARGDSMARRSFEQMDAAESARRAYIQDAAGTSAADELSKLASLKDSGVLTAEEYASLKAKVVG